MTEIPNTVWVLYASQSGTAREAAADVSRGFVRRGFDCRLTSLDDFWIKGFKNFISSNQPNSDFHLFHYAVFVISTTGQGEVPGNMRQFWNGILNSSISMDALKDWKFTIFGLGDSRYPQFNYAARKLRTRLKQLKAQEFYRFGLGDEQHDFGYEGEFDPWLEKLFELIDTNAFPDIQRLQIRNAMNENVDIIIINPDFIVKEIPSSRDDLCSSETLVPLFDDYRSYLSDRPLCPHPSPIISQVQSIQRLTSIDHFQDVKHLQISLPSSINLFPGDCISIYPSIPSDIVLQFIQETLQRDPSAKVQVQLSSNSIRPDNPFPRDANNQEIPLTLFEIFSYFLDITAIPTRHFFHVISYFTDNQQHRDKLREFAGFSLESKDAYYEYCKSERRTIAEVLWDFCSCHTIPLSQLFSIIPTIEPRKYTAASTKYWYLRSFWWTIGCSTLINSPMIWGRSSQWVMQKTIKREKRKTGDGLWKSLFGRNESSKEIAHQIIRKWKKCEMEFYWKPIFERRLQRKTEPDVELSESEIYVDLCIAIVKYKTKLQRDKIGLCSSYLSTRKVGDLIAVTVEPGTGLGINWQPSLKSPLLLIAPGTGLTPCRSLIQERYIQWQCRNSIRDTGKISSEEESAVAEIGAATMVLGFRNPNKDFLYATEWDYFIEHSAKNDKGSWINQIANLFGLGKRSLQAEAIVQPLWILNLITAFSRYWPDRTVYVQDALEEESPKVAQILLNEKLHSSTVIVSGRSTPMPSQVIRACQDILIEQIPLSHNRAVQYLEEMRKNKRLIFDTWG